MMGVDIPQPFVSELQGPVGPVTVDGIPSTFHIDVDHLPDPLPKLTLGIDPLTINPVTATLTLTPVDLNLSIKELPETRTHLPADFCVGITLLGIPLLSMRLCGEAQMISEAYRPGPCERCGSQARDPGTAPDGTGA
jgi:hypothetical protein